MSTALRRRRFRAARCLLRLSQVKVRIKRQPREDEVDGVRLDLLKPGTVREVSASVGSWLIAERYADAEMRRSEDDDEFSTVKDVRASANDSPHRRSSDRGH